MRPHRYRSHSGASATVRDTERFVKIDVAHIHTEIDRTADPNKRVEICSIHIHLTALFVDQLGYLLNPTLENSVGRGVGYHYRANLSAMVRYFATEIIYRDVARLITLNWHNGKTDHYR
jgi:hypothetical protein